MASHTDLAGRRFPTTARLAALTAVLVVGLGALVADYTSTFKTARGGWVAGGGIEARLLGNWTGKIEYLHFDFGTINHRFPVPEAFFTALGSQSRIRNDIVRVGVNYKLSGG